MRLDVPLIKQRNKLGCGPTALSMILKYFGENYSESEIIEEIGIVDESIQGGTVGTFLVDNALFAKELGFKVHCHTYNLKLLDESFIGLSDAKMKEKIENELLPKHDDELDRHVLNAYLDLIGPRVNFEMKKPSLKTIEKFLKNRIPLVLAVNARVLYQKDSLAVYSGHQIAVTGFDDSIFYYNDPTPYSPEKTLEIERDELFFALSNNVLYSSAYLMAIEPEKG